MPKASVCRSVPVERTARVLQLEGLFDIAPTLLYLLGLHLLGLRFPGPSTGAKAGAKSDGTETTNGSATTDPCTDTDPFAGRPLVVVE